MSFKMGIVGLPNVGKSTLFKALTKKQVAASNYPFCTIDPNVGVVAVPDPRLEKLSQISHSRTTIPTTIEFVDIAGLVKNAHKGEGLGNQFLSHIREVDAIVEVLRDFQDANVTHVEGVVDPERDKNIIHLELIMADLNTVTKRLEKISKDAKSGDPETLKIKNVLEKMKATLDQEKFASEVNLTTEEKNLIKDLALLTFKPLIYILNIDEKNISTPSANVIKINAQLESELAELNPEETQEYLAELGIKSSSLDQLIKTSYEILNLITFFTSGEKETRAWTVTRGATAPEAAGRIHTDFTKGFIRAEVTTFDDFVKYNGETGAKTQGLVRVEGKDYIVQDGDVCYFRIAN